MTDAQSLDVGGAGSSARSIPGSSSSTIAPLRTPMYRSQTSPPGSGSSTPVISSGRDSTDLTAFDSHTLKPPAPIDMDASRGLGSESYLSAKASASARRISPRRSHPHLPHSSDSLLYHLHTDPSASHITLSNEGAPVSAHRFQLGKKGKGKEEVIGEGDEGVDAEGADERGLLDVGSSPPMGARSPQHSRASTSTGSEDFMLDENYSAPRRRSKSGGPGDAIGIGIGLMGKPIEIIPPPGITAPLHADHRIVDAHRSLSAVANEIHDSSLISRLPNRPTQGNIPSFSQPSSPSNISTPSPEPQSGFSKPDIPDSARDKALAQRGAQAMQPGPRLRTRTGTHPPVAKITARPVTAPSGTLGTMKQLLPAQIGRPRIKSHGGEGSGGEETSNNTVQESLLGTTTALPPTAGQGADPASSTSKSNTRLDLQGMASDSPSGMLSGQTESSASTSSYFERREAYPAVFGAVTTPLSDSSSEHWPAEGESPLGQGQFGWAEVPDISPGTGDAGWPGQLSRVADPRDNGSSDDISASSNSEVVDRRRSTITPAVALSVPTADDALAASLGEASNSSDNASCIDAFSQRMSDVVDAGMDANGVRQKLGPIRAGNMTIIGSAGSFAATGSNRSSQHGTPSHPGRRLDDQYTYASSTAGHTSLADWTSFIQAYSEGRWDAAKVPQAPQPSRSRPASPPRDGSRHRTSLSVQRSATAMPAKEITTSIHAAGTSDKPDVPGNPFGLTAYLSNTQSGTALAPQRTASASAGGSAKTSPIALPDIPPAIHLSAPDLNVPNESRAKSHNRRAKPGHIAFDAGAATSAATVRLASERYTLADLAPFGLPSPERELLDPMAATATLQKPVLDGIQPSSSLDTLLTARSRVRSSTARTGSPGGSFPDSLPTIAASPLGSPSGETPPSFGLVAGGPPRSIGLSGSEDHASRFPPASAPLSWSAPGAKPGQGDYFGESAARKLARSSSQTRQNPLDSLALSGARDVDMSDPGNGHDGTTSRASSGSSKPKLVAHSSHGAASKSTPSSKALFQREAPGSLNSQQLEVDPVLIPLQALGPHEETFERLGFLPSVLPPDEVARRQALARYTRGADIRKSNEALERLATLVKMVFQSRIVLLALIDDKEQWNIVDHGLGAATAPRINSLCGHAILAKSDEPMVVLDTHLDWRFANNPNVTGEPGIRFYAGAPLRTPDGYNIGSLCIIDTAPRVEFPPRQRIILKEFAAIAIREMELSRDKARLKARDRIQISMERFTRECLELDSAADRSVAGAAAKMERVYQRASKLVRKTLDVDGAVVLDLSQFESVEVARADGSLSRAYQADPYEVDAMLDEHRSETYKGSSANDTTYVDQNFSFGPLPPWIVMGSSETGEAPKNRNRGAVGREHAKFSEFLLTNPEGRIYEHVVPSWIRHVLPPGLQYAMLVPIFNIDKHPFALLCAYTCDNSKQFLEGFELQFLRAIGVVILSAVLKRRMVLADKAKSNFISNISHELRTPLHGILAAAELLADTDMDSNQVAFLQTVQACGNSLIETVNHVLDFTKLSGAAKNSLESSIRPGSVNLAKLVEETVEGCWIGQRAKTFHANSEIGSFYSPPTATSHSSLRRGSASTLPSVETVIDIGLRERGWQVFCEKGGIRRVLMNLIGNSLKFTTDGYVQVALRELAHTPGSKTIPIEVAVIDTGKGISRNFLKEQLFHPFSQENPLQTGTGLGLAIVNSIVRSESVNGKVDVWSSEGLGTEIKVTLNVEIEEPSEDDRGSNSSTDSLFGLNHTISLVNFRKDHRGANLNRDLISGYATWWGFETLDPDPEALGDVVLSEEDDSILEEMLRNRRLSMPVLILSTSRSARQSPALAAFLTAGGFAQMVFKPVGPARLEAAMRACISFLRHDTPSQATTRSLRSDYFSPRIPPMHPNRSPSASDHSVGQHAQRQHLGRKSSAASSISFRPPYVRPGVGSRQASASSATSDAGSGMETPLSTRIHYSSNESEPPGLLRRKSEDNRIRSATARPPMAPRSTTFHDASARDRAHTGPELRKANPADPGESQSLPGSPNSTFSTVSLADGGAMLKHIASAAVPRSGRVPRVMLVDDNAINLQLLGAYLRKKKIPFEQCVNGQVAVDLFRNAPAGFWDIILMDISMPVMDGIDATRAVRHIEADRHRGGPQDKPDATTPNASEIPFDGGDRNASHTSHIFALSGRATTEDKKQAFSVGVDGYLVKPVKLASLQVLFTKLGF